jgi:hypothetical protein
MNYQLKALYAPFCALLLTIGSSGMFANDASAAGADVPPTTAPLCSASGSSTLVVSSNSLGDVKLRCTPEASQLLIIVVSNGTPATQQRTLAPVTDTAVNQMAGVTDPRVDTYAKRQAIRDQYRGRINETTFNDELADGVGLDQALADSLDEFMPAPTPTGRR